MSHKCLNWFLGLLQSIIQGVKEGNQNKKVMHIAAQHLQKKCVHPIEWHSCSSCYLLESNNVLSLDDRIHHSVLKDVVATAQLWAATGVKQLERRTKAVTQRFVFGLRLKVAHANGLEVATNHGNWEEENTLKTMQLCQQQSSCKLHAFSFLKWIIWFSFSGFPNAESRSSFWGLVLIFSFFYSFSETSKCHFLVACSNLAEFCDKVTGHNFLCHLKDEHCVKGMCCSTSKIWLALHLLQSPA